MVKENCIKVSDIFGLGINNKKKKEVLQCGSTFICWYSIFNKMAAEERTRTVHSRPRASSITRSEFRWNSASHANKCATKRDKKKEEEVRKLVKGKVNL